MIPLASGKNVIDILVNGKDYASTVFKKIGIEAEQAFERAERALESLEREMMHIPKANIDVDLDIDGLMTKLSTIEAKLEELDKKKVDIDVDVDTNKAIGALSRLENSMKRIRDRGMEIGERMVDMAENTTQGITVPLALLGAAAFKASLDFERMSTILKTNLRGVGKDIRVLEDISKEVFLYGLGKDVEEVGRAVAIARTKFQQLNDQKFGSLMLSLFSISEALGIDVNNAIDEVEKMMKRFGISSEQALDLLANGMTEAELESKNLSKALSDAKGKTDELHAAMMNDSTTFFKGELRRLQDALKPLGDAMKEMAKEYLPELTDKVKEFGKWFDEQEPKVKKAIVAFTLLLAVIPLVTLTLGALIMMGSQVVGFFGTLAGIIGVAGKALLDIGKKFTGAGTAAGRAASRFLPVVGIFVSLYLSSKKFAEYIDNTLKGVWKSLEKTIKDLKKEFEPLKKEWEELEQSFKELRMSLEPLIDILGVAFGGALAIVGGTINGLLRSLAPFISSFLNLGKTVGWLTEAFIDLLNLDFEGAWEAYLKANDAFIDALKDAWKGVEKFFEGLWDTLVDIAAEHGIDLNKVVEDTANWFVKQWEDTKKRWEDLWDGFWKTIEDIGQKIEDWFSDVGQWFEDLWDNSVQSLQEAWQSVEDWFSETWEGIISTIEEKWNEFLDWLAEIFEPIIEVIQPYLDWIEENFNELVEFFKITWEMIKAIFKLAWKVISEWLEENVQPIIDWLVEKWEECTKWLSEKWDWLKKQAERIWQGIEDNVIQPIKDAVEWLKNKWDGFISWCIGKWKYLEQRSEDNWKAIEDNIITPIKNAVKWLEDKWNSVTKWLSDKWNSLKTSASEKWGSIRESIEKPIENAANKVKGWIDKIENWFKNMKITIPKPRLPKIDVSTGYKTVAGVKIPYPVFDFKWMAKGGIVDGATIVGVGEKGAEAIVPLTSERMRPFAEAISENIKFPQSSESPFTLKELKQVMTEAFKEAFRATAQEMQTVKIEEVYFNGQLDQRTKRELMEYLGDYINRKQRISFS